PLPISKDQRLFFNIQFSRPFKSFEQFPSLGGQGGVSPITKIAFEFNPSEGNELEIKVAISAVDEAGAKKNLEAEIAEKSFQQIKNEAETVWEKQLAKIDVSTSLN